MKKILITFAGRENRMQPQAAFAREILDRGLADEWHIWNFSRNPSDHAWLNRQFGARKRVQKPMGHLEAASVFTGEVTLLDIDVPNLKDTWLDIHLGDQQVTRIEFGERHIATTTWPETQHAEFTEAKNRIARWLLRSRYFSSRLKEPSHSTRRARAYARIERWSDRWATRLARLKGSNPSTAYLPLVQSSTDLIDGKSHQLSIQVDTVSHELVVSLNGTKLLRQHTDAPHIASVEGGARLWTQGEWSSGNGSERITLVEPQLKGYSGFQHFYEEYNKSRYSDALFVKMDDDVIFCDVDEFGPFIEAVIGESPSTLLSANVINNGVCAHYQQQWGYFEELDEHFEYPDAGVCGSLWMSATKCETLHRYFCAHADRILTLARQERRLLTLPRNHRFSINFIAFKQPVMLMMSLAYIKTGMTDDEHLMTVTLDELYGITKKVWEPLIVSHLSFFKQEDRLEVGDIMRIYAESFPPETGRYNGAEEQVKCA